MTNPTPSASEFSEPIESFEKIIGEAGTATTRLDAQVFFFENYTDPRPQTPANYSSIGDLVAQWEQDADSRAALEQGRQWVADTFYAADGDTVRSLRLRKGWSQTRLAQALGTSQSHVARIERGSENLAIGTCRRLAAALDIDMNTLDRALKLQEAILAAKQT